MNAAGGSAAAPRLAEVDALRGVAALAVLLFHYTARFVELYAPAGAPSLAFPHGHYGVNLFFVVSGFVIFMTLERTRTGMDFVVSRFSRLFPVYWAAIALTFAVTSGFGLPGKEVTALQALGNVVMLHGFASIPHVDDVYWTLEVELLFYVIMLLLFLRSQLARVHQLLWALLALRLAYYLSARLFGIDLPWTLARLLILTFIPWFALGICIYQATLGRSTADPRAWRATALAALACLAVVDHWGLAVLAALLAGLVWAAATGRLPWLAHPVLVFFGTISYPLYLVHENIGWVVQRAVLAQALPFDVSAVVAFGVSVTLAALLTRTVEQPAMRAIRARYRERTRGLVA